VFFQALPNKCIVINVYMVSNLYKLGMLALAMDRLGGLHA
jgi:hypothetical protein